MDGKVLEQRKMKESVEDLLAGGATSPNPTPSLGRDKRTQNPRKSPRQSPMPIPATSEARELPEQWAGQAKIQGREEADSRIRGT